MVIMKFSNKKRILAFGIFEILISLAIFGVGVISITSLNIKSYRVIKNNELADFSDRTMIKALEYFKSPTTTDGVQEQIESDILNHGNIISYGVKDGSLIDDGVKLLFVNKGENNISRMITQCNLGNQFRVQATPNTIYENLELCLQVIVSKQENGYLIRSRVVYNIDTETKINELIGYRPFTYVSN